MSLPNERRQFQRFRPKDGTMAVSQHVLGPILNISMGGLSFQYIGTIPDQKMPDTLGVFLGSDDILIEKIATRLISDTLRQTTPSFLKSSTRQRSLQFIHLSDKQRTMLQDFIGHKTISSHHSTAPPSPSRPRPVPI